MNIVGKGFLLLLGFATLISAALTLWLWPRLAGRGPRPIAGRIGLLLTTQLTLAATFLFTINALGGFYTSWAQLFGDSSTQYQLNNAEAGQPGAPAHNAQQLVLAPNGHGQLVGVRSGVTAQLEVFTPANSAPTAHLPVAVVDQTGSDSGPGSTLTPPPFQQIATTHHVIVAVVTSAEVIPGVNVPAGTQGELFWSQDLRTALASHYRVDTSPADWGVAGADQSGTAAINLAIQDSTHYGLAAAVGNWTSAPPQDSWPGIDRYLGSVPTPSARVLYDPTAANIPAKLRPAAGPLQIATQSALTLTSAIDWLAASLQADAGAPA